MTARSSDHGVSWSAIEPLTANAITSGEAVPQTATDGAGHWVAVWPSTDGHDGHSTAGISNIFVALGGACGATPRSGCRSAASSSLQLKNGATDAKDKLAWKWAGASTSLAELADPTASAGYALCIYDQNGAILEANVPAAGMCGSKPCWSAKRAGFAFKDRAAVHDGVQSLSVKASAVDKAAAAVKGKGINLPVPALGSFAMPLTAHLVNLGTNVCLEANFDSDAVSKNSTTELKAKVR